VELIYSTKDVLQVWPEHQWLIHGTLMFPLLTCLNAHPLYSPGEWKVQTIRIYECLLVLPILFRLELLGVETTCFYLMKLFLNIFFLFIQFEISKCIPTNQRMPWTRSAYLNLYVRKKMF
jgi:hypothetical protein